MYNFALGDMVKGPASTDARETMHTVSFLAQEATYDMVLMDIVCPRINSIEFSVTGEWVKKSENMPY